MPLLVSSLPSSYEQRILHDRINDQDDAFSQLPLRQNPATGSWVEIAGPHEKGCDRRHENGGPHISHDPTLLNLTGFGVGFKDHSGRRKISAILALKALASFVLHGRSINPTEV